MGAYGIVMMIRLPEFDLLRDNWGRAAAEEHYFTLGDRDYTGSDALLDEMMNRFGKERQALENQRDRLVTDTSEEKSIRDAYDLFFALAQRYSHIETLDRDILHALIERIEIGEKILPEGLTIAGPRTPYRQSIRIFYRFIGEIAENPVRDVTRVANL